MLIQKTRRQNVSPKFCRNLELQKSPVAWQLRRGTGEVVEPTSWYPFSSRFISYAGFCIYVHISSICSISSVCCYSNVFFPHRCGTSGTDCSLTLSVTADGLRAFQDHSRARVSEESFLLASDSTKATHEVCRLRTVWWLEWQEKGRGIPWLLNVEDSA